MDILREEGFTYQTKFNHIVSTEGRVLKGVELKSVARDIIQENAKKGIVNSVPHFSKKDLPTSEHKAWIKNILRRRNYKAMKDFLIELLLEDVLNTEYSKIKYY